MAVSATVTRELFKDYFSYAQTRYTYLMKNAKSMRSFQDITTLKQIFEIYYNDHTARTWTFEDIHDLTDQLQAANNNMAPKEAWQFHRRGALV